MEEFEYFKENGNKNLEFYYDKSNRRLCFNNTNDETINFYLELYSDGYGFINRCGIIPYEVYSIDKLLDADFFINIRFEYFDYLNINRVRSLLYSIGLMNRKDISVLLALGFKEEDLHIRISDLGLKTREKNALIRSYITHLWQLVLYEKADVRSFRKCGPKSHKDIVDAVESTGYNFYDPEIIPVKQEELSGDTESNIHKILASRAKYLSIIEEYNKKLDETNKLLEEEVKKLLKTNNN